MSIRDWPAGERPREKLLEQGSQALSEAELLAILIRTGTRGRSAIDVARDLLTEFGSLRSLLTADRERVCAANGLGPARYYLRVHIAPSQDFGAGEISPQVVAVNIQ